MAHTLSEPRAANIRKVIDQTTADQKKLPGAVAVVTSKDGEIIFSHASGTKGCNSTEPMTLDSVFWIASCTKLIGGIAVMQLCEQGKLSLDDPELVENVAPELKNIRILKCLGENGKPQYVDKTKRITLRMLLTHTAGFGYTFFDEDLAQWGFNTFSDEFDGLEGGILSQPLVFEPGTQWQYGIGIDWAGTIVERVSDMPLNEYLQKHIFQPLGIKDIDMFPSKSMKDHLAHMHQRTSDGKIFQRNHLQRRPLLVKGEDIAKTYHSAGAGCFAKPVEYCKILATLLNSGISPTTGHKLLESSTVDEMFTNQIPQFPNFGRQGVPAAKPDLTNPLPDLYPEGPDTPQGWGLTFMLSHLKGGAGGRGQGTAWWAGLANLYWWCDREKGVAGMVASQVLPFADPNVLGLWVKIENMVYEGLEKGADSKI